MSTLALNSLLLAMKHFDARIESLHDKIEELKRERHDFEHDDGY